MEDIQDVLHQRKIRLLASNVEKDSFLSTITWAINEDITELEAKEIQTYKGYNPAGYGFYKFRYENGQTKWQCARSSG